MNDISTRTDEPGGSSPFHAGEAAMQTRVGVRERLEHIGRHVIRDYLPDEHRELFDRLPMLIVGSLDTGGRPWASLLAGWPGFIDSPDARTLHVNAVPADGDPLGANLATNAPIALLGIELATRRRNRANGTVAAAGDGGFTVHVEQSFGNCPQYIQARRPSFELALPAASVAAPETRAEGRLLSERAAALVGAADTFFIATAAAAVRGGDPVHGCDVSHRGGRPGFVRVASEQGGSVLYAPDFRGNFFFNTLGNLAVNPRAGLLFMDFASGAALMLTGTAEVLWDGPLVAGFAGAQRMLRFVPETGVWLPDAAQLYAGAGVALRWSAPEPAPQLAGTGP